jgi:formylglycine-generating enzyme required for sulfatase activity
MSKTLALFRAVLLSGLALVCASRSAFGQAGALTNLDAAIRVVRGYNFPSLRLAISDLSETYGDKYSQGRSWLERLSGLEPAARTLLADLGNGEKVPPARVVELAAELKALRRDALLANPLLRFENLLLVKHDASRFRLPRNDACYASIPQTGYACEIAILSLRSPERRIHPAGALTTLFKAPGTKYLADLDLHFDADKLLFTMPGTNRWQVFELRADGSGLRQVTSSPHDDVDSFDPCYLPGGKIIFCSTANYQSVPCYNGTRKVGGLYLMEAGGQNVRQLTFDQDDDSYPSVMNNGRVMFTRWEYAGTPHFFTRLVFQMNPDGSGQEELYGSNSWWPNAVYYERSLPSHPTRFVGIVSGHHGDRRMGELVIFDPATGRQEASGIVQRIPGRGRKVEPVIKDTLVNDSWPKFMSPWPLSDKYFLVACKPSRKSEWGIYLADVFDNLFLLHEAPGCVLTEPIPFVRRPTPPALPEQIQPGRRDALVYMADVYTGGGLKGVPRGQVKRLRLLSPHYGYLGNAGWMNVAIDGPWDVQRILGTVPVRADGSAYFRVPANTPISVQPLDAEGKAIQLMRSWFTAMPGEIKSCVGCHEGAATAAPNVRAASLTRPPDEITPWHGPARGFSFERDVQPVLDAHCVSCHNGQAQADGKKPCDLRARRFFPDYQGVIAPIPQVITNWQVPTNITADDMGVETCELSERRQERIQFTPAYEALHPYVRRGGLESDAHMLMPYEFHADTSELVQMLLKGHYGAQLDAEAWDRLITWIDLNVPCHGTWHEVYPIPFNGHERRREYLRLYAGIDEDYEAVPELTGYKAQPAKGLSRQDAASPGSADAPRVVAPGFPFDAHEARERQVATASLRGLPVERNIPMGDRIALQLVLIPAGEFLMGNAHASEDERPLSRVPVPRPFWMGKFEVRNCEYAVFDAAHDSGYISQLGTAVESRGYPVNGPDQPVVRVSWQSALAFCDWLSRKTGFKFSLPTEAQWEYACRAGTPTALWYGAEQAIFKQFGNMADRKLEEMARRVPGKMLYSDNPDWVLRDDRSLDGALVTANVGSYLPNAWGLHDLHGNAAEWTRTTYRPYPYRADDGRDAPTGEGRKVARGGSWYDRPKRCTSSFTLSYPPWQAVYNVGFRVVCEIE